MVKSLQTTAGQTQDGKPTKEAAAAKDAVTGYRRLLDRTVKYGETVPEDLTTVQIDSQRQAKMEALLARRMEPKVGATLKSNALILQQVGAFFGMLVFSMLAVRIGRRLSFALAFTLAWASIYLVFLGFHEQHQIWYMFPLLGFCTLLPFGGYAVYLPSCSPRGFAPPERASATTSAGTSRRWARRFWPF